MSAGRPTLVGLPVSFEPSPQRRPNASRDTCVLLLVGTRRPGVDGVGVEVPTSKGTQIRHQFKLLMCQGSAVAAQRTTQNRSPSLLTVLESITLPPSRAPVRPRRRQGPARPVRVDWTLDAITGARRLRRQQIAGAVLPSSNRWARSASLGRSAGDRVEHALRQAVHASRSSRWRTGCSRRQDGDLLRRSPGTRPGRRRSVRPGRGGSPVALEAFGFLVHGIAFLGFLEPADPLMGGGERDAVAALAGLDPQGDRQMR
jgi:hypothetical protein